MLAIACVAGVIYVQQMVGTKLIMISALISIHIKQIHLGHGINVALL